ncbi:PREDICTED: ribose-phosphate pyrophosphokinase 4-like isoform X4 [Lupinus angustifolius]|uniref:ribose-phosphate pyrophosphokinase 4-like isoform X4 n=1 Tax=Lupinus angustifolius TaxID=3871 RepID=UPI00092EFF53|nr:PREDICTED: ribose-phosphate pyrophosphokinase 4-like isoform X4 [Lupinus angustifolius]
MAATPPAPSFSPPSNKFLKPNSSHSLFLPKPVKPKNRYCFNLNCEVKSFNNHNIRTFTIEHISNMNKDNSTHNNNTSSSLVSVSAATSASQFHTKNAKKVVLFYCTETKSLAEKIAAETDAIELRTISWGKFPDGFPNIFIPNAQGIRGQHVAFLASFSSPAVIFEQIPVIYALPKLFVASFSLVLPFFPTGTSERMEDEGDVATAFTLARLLSNIPISRGGPTSLVIFDIHALQISIAFPDDGAWKRFHMQLQHFPTIVCAKVREGDQRIVRIKEGEPKGRHVVIVDDLVQSGGTLIECQKVLASHGAAKISAYVTHGIFPNKSWTRFGHDNGGHPETAFTYFWITDSCPLTVKEVMNKPPFEVLSLASSISTSLQI